MRSLIPVGFVALLCTAGLAAQGNTRNSDAAWTRSFNVEPAELVSTGKNPYFVLEPGATLTLSGGQEQLVVTVLNETRTIDGIETRVVEERETNGGALVEVSRNYFAISRRTNSVFYFGEEVDIYKNGQITGHEGAWVSGQNGTRFGLMMPGLPLLGAKYHQELAPRVAMDRAEIVSLSETLATPAGKFTNVLRVRETTPLEPGASEFKYYAAGIGLVQDGSLKLTSHAGF
jgi:hypothetical protein